MWLTEKPPLAKPARPKAHVVAVTPLVVVRAVGINMSATAAPRKPANEMLAQLILQKQKKMLSCICV